MNQSIFLSPATFDTAKYTGQLVMQQPVFADMSAMSNVNYSTGATTAYGFPTKDLNESLGGGAWGADEGAMTRLPDHRLFGMYGDSRAESWDTGTNHWLSWEFNSTCKTTGQLTGGTFGCFLKAILIIPANGGAFPTQPNCTVMNDIDQALFNSSSPTIDYTNCWSHTIIQNTARAAGQPLMATTLCASLPSDPDGYSVHCMAGHIPNAVWVDPTNGHVMVQWNLSRSQLFGVVGNAGFFQLAGLMDCGPYSSITTPMASDLTCTYKYTFSQAPLVYGGTGSSGATIAANGTDLTLAGVGCGSGQCSFQCYMSTGVSGSCAGSPGAHNLVFVDAETNNQHQAYQLCNIADATHATLCSADSAHAGTTVDWTVQQWQETNLGKFQRPSVRVFHKDSSLDYESPFSGWKSGLPAGLQNVNDVMCAWSAGFPWRTSNMYLFCMDATKISTSSYSFSTPRENAASGGIADAYYFTGYDGSHNPTWSQGHEESAVTLFTTIAHTVQSKFQITDISELEYNLGEVSVLYVDDLGVFLACYGSAETQGLWCRSAYKPWGPWSVEFQIMDNNGTLSHGSWTAAIGDQGSYHFNTDTPNNAPLNTGVCTGAQGGVCTNIRYTANTNTLCTTAAPCLDNGGGHAYTPYFYGTWTNHNNGIVDVFGHLAMFNWYSVFDYKLPLYATYQQGAIAASSAGGGVW